ncbi:rhodanese-like domain-containing protein [Peribacillus asahii]|uniref:Rhodanese-like domain-containing protein n=1 Tax=Peribacillus asahii TaxID=228899 RepID=A0A398BNL5_9BACI|nr:rhodanese-like domain-containing protein [Peribacillus asahii]RID89400.1 rhodanese-like domain-containing protein [Peribacillus asahii]
MEFLYSLLIFIVIVVAYSLITWFRQKRAVTALTQEEFIAGYRKVQLIDVREPNDFENGHILGARNIPLTQLKTRLVEIRPDKPVYLYAQSEIVSGRAALLLKKKGYKELYHLKGGFKMWTGKIKKKS